MTINNFKINMGRLIFIFLVMISVSGCAGRTISLQKPLCSSFEAPQKRIKDSSSHYVSCNKEVSIKCKPLMLTEIKLLPNERVISLNAGDTARWLFQTIMSNTDNNPTTHILIKPKDSHIKTNLIIATNQRIYHINLISDEEETTKSSFSFYDPINNSDIDDSHVGKIDSNYEVRVPYFKKVPKWVPDCVYNDGTSVFIYMPFLNRYSAPSFYVLDEHEQLTILNYQVGPDYYRVDQLFSKGVLIRGVGRNREKVMINYLGDL